VLQKVFNKLHILHNIYIKNKSFIKKKSYSLDGEDLFVEKYFKEKTSGIYVDVGCHNPIYLNNTFLLHKKKWKGINIDISQFSIDLFNYMRPNDLNYNCAISNNNEDVKLYFQKDFSLLNTIQIDHAKKFMQGNIKEKTIKPFTLDEILSKSIYKDSKIDFLDIDIEGADLKALEGLSFDKFKPELICVEIHENEIKKSKLYKFLVDKKYELIWSSVFSHIFKNSQK
jgi:FkbM family methyltransferase